MFYRGQAFDVFKLLIAAVVAIALLAVLLPIITNIGGIGQNEPNSTAAQTIKDLVNQPSLARLTDKVIFKQEDSLSATAIATKTNILAKDQVCVLAGEFEGQSAVFEAPSSSLVKYIGNGTRTVKLSVMCDSANALQQDLVDNGLADSIKNVNTCSCVSGGTSGGSSQTCCIVAIRQT